MFTKKLALMGFAAVLFAGGAMAQEVMAPKKLINPGKLTYGTAATFAPFEYTENGKLVGFDIELGEMLAEKMGLETAPLNMEFKGLIPALQGTRIDIINSAMYINEERAKQVEFVPYLKIGNEIIVKAGNPHGIKSRADVCGRTIAVTLGGIQESYAREDATRCEGEGKPTVTVLTFPTAQDSALAVRVDRADIFYNSTPGAVKQLSELPGIYELAGETFESNTRIGIALRKDDMDGKRAIEEALAALVADGSYDALIERYNLPKSVALLSQ
ncbi:ABC transporter substrate-binding protein [Limibacillus sp. MBR-115]|jgi:polar amino acid transport system substrate-binding protein|uniref:ABC transporter substrate-binding protein n=1 Tax=Limibacillus sp. MBR-115 TaxID=3156465 RepID=UPI00339B3F53